MSLAGVGSAKPLPGAYSDEAFPRFRGKMSRRRSKAALKVFSTPSGTLGQRWDVFCPSIPLSGGYCRRSERKGATLRWPQKAFRMRNRLASASFPPWSPGPGGAARAVGPSPESICGAPAQTPCRAQTGPLIAWSRDGIPPPLEKSHPRLVRNVQGPQGRWRCPDIRPGARHAQSDSHRLRARFGGFRFAILWLHSFG